MIILKLRSYFLSLWNLLDPLYYCCSRLSYIDKDNRKDRVFRVRLTRYRGENIRLSDGTYICKNDKLLKIHLHNVKLLKNMSKFNNDFRRGLYLYNQIKRALPGLSKFIDEHPDQKNIKAIVGITMLHQGSDRLGFEIHPIKNKFYLRLKQVTQFPIYFISSIHPKQKKKEKPLPHYLFMTRGVLDQKFHQI